MARPTIAISVLADVSRAQQNLNRLGQNLNSFGDKAGQAGTRMVVAGGLIAAGLGYAVNKAADFEEQLSGIKAVSGATAAEMEKIRTKALQLGADTSFSASQAAEAMSELSKAGVSTTDILGGAADAAVALAAAGGIELPEAATIASNAMNQFSLAGKDLPRVADLIAGAANASAIDVSDFGYSLSQSGAVANLAGLSFEDLTVAIAEMGNAGIKGSDAGTSLKTMFSALQPTTKKQIDAMRDLGLITADGTNRFYDQQGNLKSLRGIQELLGTSMEGLTKKQQSLALRTIFGSDAIRAGAVLAKSGAEGYDKMSESINKTTAADVAKTRLDNLNGAIEQMKGSAETAAIQLGTLLIPVMRAVVEAVTGAINSFVELDPEIQKTIVTVAAVASAMLLAAGIALKVVQGIMAVNAAMLFLAANPVGLVIIGIAAAVAALVAGLVYAYNNFLAFRTAVNTVVDAITNGTLTFEKITAVISTLVYGIAELFGGVDAGKRSLTVMTDLFRNLGDYWNLELKPALLGIVGAFREFISTVVPIVQRIVAAIVDKFHELEPQIRDTFEKAKTYIVDVMTLVQGIIERVTQAIAYVWANYGDQIVATVQNVFGVISGVINGVMTAIGGIIRTVISIVTGDWDAGWENVKAIFTGVWTVITSLLSGIGQGLVNALQVIWTTIKNAASAAWDSIKKTIVEAALGLVQAVLGALGPLGDLIDQFTGIKSAGSTATSGIAAVDAAMANAVRSGNAAHAAAEVAKLGLSAAEVRSQLPSYTAALVDTTQAQTNTATAATNAIGPTDELKASQHAAGTAAENLAARQQEATDRLSAWHDELSKSGDRDNYVKSLKRMSDGLEAANGKLTGNSDAALAARESLRGALSGLASYAEGAKTAEGKSKRLADGLESIRKRAEKAGIPRSVIDGFLADFQTIESGAVQAGEGIGSGIEQGIANKRADAMAAAQELGAAAARAAKAGAEVFSPSRITITAGEGIADGFSVGMANRLPAVSAELAAAGRTLGDVVAAAVDPTGIEAAMVAFSDSALAAFTTREVGNADVRVQQTQNHVDGYTAQLAKINETASRAQAVNDDKLRDLERKHWDKATNDRQIERLKDARDKAIERANKAEEDDKITDAQRDAAIAKAKATFAREAKVYRERNAVVAGLEAANAKIQRDAASAAFDVQRKLDAANDELVARVGISDAAKRAAQAKLVAFQGAINTAQARLSDLATQRQAKALEIDAATKALTEAVGIRDSLRDAVAKSITEFGSLMNATFDAEAIKASGQSAGAAYAEAQRVMLERARVFDYNLQQLRTRGLNATTYEELLRKGVEGGGAIAQALVDDSSVIGFINDTQSALGQLADSVSTTNADLLYGAGVSTAQGYLDGLRSQDAQLAQWATDTAAGLVAALKRELGIASPSRVLKTIGGYSVDGLVEGLRDTVEVERAAAGLSSAVVSGYGDASLIVDQRASGGFASSGGTIPPLQITVTTLDPRAAGPMVVQAIREYEASNGTRWRGGP